MPRRDQLASDRGVQVKMLVRIDVVKGKPARTICFKLRLNFRCDLSGYRGAREYIKSKPR